MSTFQIVFIVVCAAQALLAFRRFVKTRQFSAFVFSSAWAAAVVAIANPAMSTWMANSVGIGRGVDFVTYSVLVVFLWAHYEHYLRYKRVENEVTILIRELAMTHAVRPAPRPVANAEATRVIS